MSEMSGVSESVHDALLGLADRVRTGLYGQADDFDEQAFHQDLVDAFAPILDLEL